MLEQHLDNLRDLDISVHQYIDDTISIIMASSGKGRNEIEREYELDTLRWIKEWLDE